MLGSAVLDVAIGVALVFLLLSTICTAVREGIESFVKSRAAYLEYGIRELLHDRGGSGLAASLYRHPLIHGLFLGDYQPSSPVETPPILAQGRGLPSYIPARSFAIALLDIAARGARTDLISSDPASAPLSVESVRANLLNLQNPAVQRVLLDALDTAQGDFDAACANVEAWFNSGMQRVSGWYKRSTQWIVLVIALCATMLLNVDTIRIAQFLYQNDAARNAVVQQAQQATSDPNRSGEEAGKELAALPLPIGWDGQKPGESGLVWLTRVLGWLLTAIAATLGAPFWFDVLSKVMVVRSTVKPHEKSPEQTAQEQQPRPEARAEQAPAIVVTATRGEVRPVVATFRDPDSDIDACDVAMNGETRDDQLPAALGGVG
jgi:hypothetical protein